MDRAAPAPDSSLHTLDALAETAHALLRLAAEEGASQAEVSCAQSRGLSVGVRLGEVETVESTQDRSVGVTLYFGQKKGSASSGDLRPESLKATVRQAAAIARHTEEDSAAGLADAALMATDLREFDSWHPEALDADDALHYAREAEAAGRALDGRISNSEGASFSCGQSLGVYANSHGFTGRERSTHYSLGLALIAGQGEAMQRDGWYSAALALEDLQPAAALGEEAARRALARLAPRQLATCTLPVIFSAQMARGLLGHYLAAVSGGALYRRASFLCESAGERLFPEWFWMEEDPFLPRGFRSGAFDAEGVATRRSHLVQEGKVARYILGSYSARKLGLATTANAGGVHNVHVAANAESLAAIIGRQRRALLVTELMGQGINMITGDYSRGAAGFVVENGEIAYPVDGITIAGNLRQIFAAIEAVGADIDPWAALRTGPVLVGQMTVAGS